MTLSPQMLSLLGDKDVTIVVDNARSPIHSVTKSSHQMHQSCDSALPIIRKHFTSRWESMPKKQLYSDSGMSSLCDMAKMGLKLPMRVGCRSGMDKKHRAALSIIMPERRPSLDRMDTAARLGQVLDDLDLSDTDDSTSVLSDQWHSNRNKEAILAAPLVLSSDSGFQR
jgi:hypothetical protein